MYTIVGLGNPGEEYELTRHNTGRMVVEDFAKANKFSEWAFDKKINALKSEACLPARQGKIKKEKILLLLPETFMNNSGNAVFKIITSKKKTEQLVVIHDDLDLPLGKFKISFAKSSAGHRGVESVIKKIKTDKFIRIRVGTCPRKKPDGKELIKFLMGKFTPKELSVFKKT
ncbi:MAG: aminoacyl-tRNA hydrolase, partial [Candidatus Tagabacteria bacterium]